MSNEVNWDRIRALAQRVLAYGEPLELSDETRALLIQSAQEVAIGTQDAEDALRSAPTATTLLGEIRQRIREGANRLGEAEDRVEELQEKGSLSEAQHVLRNLLAVEVVPFYRQQARRLLDDVTKLAAVSYTHLTLPTNREV